ncbi:putative multiple sugar transport system ATP-binding protein [Mycetocola miduiensis]|uniref:Putative multiple sugar transport system ATP-binding protein n=2 Tax=Mycetocola miduiensis TaxID=995034 RepID=A0A1I4YHF7_9MICO|nr:putative multiple sugar transport system ATP-binding protein [Mycetocola miduiensis]
MPLSGALPDGARLIAVLGDPPAVDGVPVLGVESLLIPLQTVADNVLLGATSGFFLNKSSRERRAMELIDRVGLAVPPTTPVFELDAVDQRIVELAGILGRTPEVVLVDDRSSRFDAAEALRWHTALAHATEVAPVLVAVNTLADLRFSPRAVDCVAVLRAGDVVGTAGPADTDRLLGLLVGDGPAVTENADDAPENRPFGPVVLELRNISVSHPVHRERMLVEDASLAVRAGEIVGLADAQDLVLGVFGASSGGEVSGTILLDGAPADLSTVERAIASRVLFISEHPPTYDIGLLGGIPTSVSGEKLARLARMGVIDRRREYLPRQAPSMLIDALSGARSRPSTAAMNEVLAGWVANPPRVAMITEPFSGLSPAEQGKRRALIERIAAAGVAVILESTEPEQLVGLSDRLLLQHGRRLATELRGEDATLRGVAAFRTRTDFPT